jgi:hypothetical protein
MRRWILLAVWLAAGCGDGTGPATLPAELVGTWVAEPACLPQCGFTFESRANAADSISATALGITTEIRIGRTGDFRLSSTPATAAPVTGTVTADGTTMTVRDPQGNSEIIDYSVAGNRLTIAFRSAFHVWDFSGDGNLDPATARGVFAKR